MQMEIKRLDDELNKSKSVFSDEKRRILEGNSLQEIFNFERITLKTQITSLQLDKDALEKKIKSKKAKINFFKSELKNTNSKEPETNISKLKVENIELKLNNEKNNAEIKTLKIKVETLLAEIEKLGKQLIDTTEDFLKSQEEYDNLNLKLNLLQEGFSSANIQINLLDEKNTMLEEILDSLEEGKKKLQDLKNSVNFQKNTSSLQKNKEGIAKSFKDLNELPQKMNELKKIIDKNRNESNKISLESISDFHNESYENEIESSQNFNKKKIEKNYSQDNIENMKKNSANRGISNKLKESGFKKMDSSKDVGLPTEYAKINDKNFKKNDEKIINHEKIINNLENKLQNEIIQKEKFLQQNQMLEQTIILLKQAKGIPNGDQIKDSEIKQNSQIIKNKKNNLPPLNEEKMKNVSEILYEKNNSKTTEPLNKTSETNFKNKLKKEINNINKTEDINKFISENPYNLQNDINKTTINCNNNENNGVKNNENSPLLKKNSLTCHITNLDKNDNPVNSNNENHPHGKINDKTENLQKNLPQNDFFSNKSNLVSDNFLAFDINSQKYLSKKNYNLANNKYTLNNQYPSQQSLYKADKILNSEHSVFDTFTSEESLINPSSLKNLELFPNKKRNIRREEENKKENEKMNIMYENLQDLIKIEGSNLMKVSPPELSKFFQKLSERKKDNVVNALGNDEKILIENEHLNLRIEEFKEVINEIKSEHRRCGPTCIHLKRFYEKLGFSEKKLGKKLYHLHKRIINKLPKIE